MRAQLFAAGDRDVDPLFSPLGPRHPHRDVRLADLPAVHERGARARADDELSGQRLLGHVAPMLLDRDGRFVRAFQLQRNLIQCTVIGVQRFSYLSQLFP